MDPKEAAVSHFDGGFNCAQAVFSALAPQVGLPEDVALKIAAPFGGGIVRSGNVCGAVTGALMAIGLKHGTADPTDKATKEKTYALGNEFMARFRAKHGDVLCRELLGCDMSTPEGHQMAKDKGLFVTLCPHLVRDAVEIAAELLDK